MRSAPESQGATKGRSKVGAEKKNYVGMQLNRIEPQLTRGPNLTPALHARISVSRGHRRAERSPHTSTTTASWSLTIVGRRSRRISDGSKMRCPVDHCGSKPSHEPVMSRMNGGKERRTGKNVETNTWSATLIKRVPVHTYSDAGSAKLVRSSQVGLRH